jgi:hypothetical protein
MRGPRLTLVLCVALYPAIGQGTALEQPVTTFTFTAAP